MFIHYILLIHSLFILRKYDKMLTFINSRILLYGCLLCYSQCFSELKVSEIEYNA